jgi:hypothetical protein
MRMKATMAIRSALRLVGPLMAVQSANGYCGRAPHPLSWRFNYDGEHSSRHLAGDHPPGKPREPGEKSTSSGDDSGRIMGPRRQDYGFVAKAGPRETF